MKKAASFFPVLFFLATATAQLPNWLKDGRLGIATELLPGGKSFKVVRAMPNSPAERAGLKPGDVVVAINDAPFQAPNKDSLVASLAGAIGSEISLTVEGGKRVKLVREALNVPASMGGPCKSGDCQNGEGVLHYPTPYKYGYYKGKFVQGLPQGEAVVYEDSTLTGLKLYEGAFSMGHYEGKGKGLFELPEVKFSGTTAIYEGNWSQSQPRGQGKMTFEDGTVLSGEFMGSEVLLATFVLPDGRRFENGLAFNYNEIVCLKKGTKNMYWYELEAGTETQASTCLSGDCANGIGELEWWDGMTYKGSFKHGLRHGKGKQTLVDGTVHEGEFYLNQVHGKATTRYNEGSVFTGSYFFSSRHGTGKLTSPNGTVFEGEYRDNLPNGHGKFTYADGSTYEGGMKNGKWHGQGVYFNKSTGNTYTGGFKDDELHGIVEVTTPGGSVQVMEYHNGDPVRLTDLIWSPADWQRNQAERARESQLLEQKRKEQDAQREATLKSSGSHYAPPIGNVTDAQAQLAMNVLMLLPGIADELDSDARFISSIRGGDVTSYGNNMTWVSINAEKVVGITRRGYEASRVLHAYFQQKGACHNAVSLIADSENLLSACLDDAMRRKDAAKQLLGGPGKAYSQFVEASNSLLKRLLSASEKFGKLSNVTFGCK